MDVFVGIIVELLYLWKFAFVSGADKTFGLRDNDGTLYTGNKEANIKEKNTILGDMEYVGTPGLWENIVATTPVDKIFTNGDYDNYAEILHSLRRNNDESETKPKANKCWKWKHILKPIWDEKDLCTGNGTTLSGPIILPYDPIVPRERLDILMACNAAGNTGVRKEMVSVCDELLWQNLIDKHKYKITMLQIINC